ncbi:MAG: hypothetical protein LBB14_01520 [Puniceicoccales bacterium]|jgi:hypothetical protein|nr:hypothetical protein [Puniceicoccales bacterium]
MDPGAVTVKNANAHPFSPIEGAKGSKIDCTPASISDIIVTKNTADTISKALTALSFIILVAALAIPGFQAIGLILACYFLAWAVVGAAVQLALALYNAPFLFEWKAQDRLVATLETELKELRTSRSNTVSNGRRAQSIAKLLLLLNDRFLQANKLFDPQNRDAVVLLYKLAKEKRDPNAVELLNHVDEDVEKAIAEMAK